MDFERGNNLSITMKTLIISMWAAILASAAFGNSISGTPGTPYDLGSATNQFSGVYATNGSFQKLTVNGVAVSTNPASAFDAAGAGATAANQATNTLAGWLGSAAYTSSSAYDIAGAGTTAANEATNGFPWGSLYDAAGSATTAANQATNGFPWSGLYDAAGSATTAAQAVTNNALVKVSTYNAGSLTNYAGTNINSGSATIGQVLAADGASGTMWTNAVSATIPSGLITNASVQSILLTNSGAIGGVGFTNGAVTGNAAGMTFSNSFGYSVTDANGSFGWAANGRTNWTGVNGTKYVEPYVWTGNTNYVDPQLGPIQHINATSNVLVLGVTNLIYPSHDFNVTLMISNGAGGNITVSNAPVFNVPPRAVNTTNNFILSAGQTAVEYIYFNGKTNILN